MMDLDVGETSEVATRAGSVPIRLLSVAEQKEPDYFIAANPDRTTFARADIEIEVGGVRGRVIGRPYQYPTLINGVRLYLEATQNWGASAQLDPLRDFKKAVRLSVLDAAESWGPKDLVFPIDQYRWHSGTYNNTWGSLVPYNLLYYHRGEDFGAIPDQLPVVAMFGGKVTRTPLARRNADELVAIEDAEGYVEIYAHMNYENINPAVVPGAKIEAGQVLGKTGCTWNGGPNQHADPHVHVGIHHTIDRLHQGTDHRYDAAFPVRGSSYPMMVDAYLRKYPDPVLAVAGGYRFGTPGETIELDATRSVARPHEEIARHEWLLHDGTRVDGAIAHAHYDAPGLYSEQLIVRTKSGAEDRDYAQVRIYDPMCPRDKIVFGWFYHSPVRGIHPGIPVLFWNRLDQGPKTDEPVWIDFGDGTEPQLIAGDARHAYTKPGIYTAKLTSVGFMREPLTIQMRVVVEP